MVLKYFMRLASVLLVSIVFLKSVQAETLVLVAGFQAQGMDWRFRNVSDALVSSGWVDGGNLSLTPRGIVNPIRLPYSPKKVFFTVDLPSSAPVAQQAGVLHHYLKAIYHSRKEPLALAGHSAGGVVARYWLVTNAGNQTPKVDTLITIAAPNIGTPVADLSGALVGTPLMDMAEQMGLGSLRQARGLYADLRQEKPGNFMYWLNHQPHPAIRYVSIVRTGNTPETADLVVPPANQDMNHIFVLHGHAEVIPTPNIGHLLTAEDGYILANVLSKPATQR